MAEDEEVDFLDAIAKKLAAAKVEDISVWKRVLGCFCGNDQGALEKLSQKLAKVGESKDEEFVDEDESCPDLYKGNFSLAYGTLTLLRDTKLHLKKDKFYGMLGG